MPAKAAGYSVMKPLARGSFHPRGHPHGHELESTTMRMIEAMSIVGKRTCQMITTLARGSAAGLGKRRAN